MAALGDHRRELLKDDGRSIDHDTIRIVGVTTSRWTATHHDVRASERVSECIEERIGWMADVSESEAASE